MDDITLNLITLVFFGFVGGGILLLVRRNQSKNEQQIIQMATENGWVVETIHERLTWGLRLKSPRWTLEAISRSSGSDAAPGSSDVAMSTIWRAPVSGSTLFISPRRSNSNLGEVGEIFSRQVLQLALGADADGLCEVKVGSEGFQQKYLIFAQVSSEIESLLTPAFESSLIACKGGQVLIKRTTGGLSIELQGVRLKKFDELRSLIELGELLLEELNPTSDYKTIESIGNRD